MNKQAYEDAKLAFYQAAEAREKDPRYIAAKEKLDAMRKDFDDKLNAAGKEFQKMLSALDEEHQITVKLQAMTKIWRG